MYMASLAELAVADVADVVVELLVDGGGVLRGER